METSKSRVQANPQVNAVQYIFIQHRAHQWTQYKAKHNRYKQVKNTHITYSYCYKEAKSTEQAEVSSHVHSLTCRS